jgi:hypothetical protein
MTLREIDDALTAWNSRLGAAAQNLMELQSEPVYQQLAGAGGAKTRLAGITAAKVDPAIGAMVAAFQHFGLLNETVERAAALRRNLPALFGTTQKLAEIEELLYGKSIHLPTAEGPLEQRTLLSGMQNSECVSPDDLLDMMARAFQAAKGVVVSVQKAWDDLGVALNRSGARIASLRAAPLDAGSWAELETAERTLKELRAKTHEDPLGALDRLDAQIQPVLTRLEAAQQARERLQQGVADGLKAARALLDSSLQLHDEAVAASTEAQLKIANSGVLPPPLVDEKLEELGQWLLRLEKKYAGGMLEPVAVGLRNWNSALDNCVVQERAALAANRGPLESRSELRGRLEALKAKARAYAFAEDDALMELADQAEALLYTRPTPLDRAAASVAEYERMVSSLQKRSETSTGKHSQ